MRSPVYFYTSETGEGNALFAGIKEPVNLRVDIDGKLLTIMPSSMMYARCLAVCIVSYVVAVST